MTDGFVKEPANLGLVSALKTAPPAFLTLIFFSSLLTDSNRDLIAYMVLCFNLTIPRVILEGVGTLQIWSINKNKINKTISLSLGKKLIFFLPISQSRKSLRKAAQTLLLSDPDNVIIYLIDTKGTLNERLNEKIVAS